MLKYQLRYVIYEIVSIFQAINPFYLFQAYTVILWSIQFYWKFAVVIAVTSVISVTFSIWETRRVREQNLLGVFLLDIQFAITYVVQIKNMYHPYFQQNRNLRDKMKSESSVECLRNGKRKFCPHRFSSAF